MNSPHALSRSLISLAVWSATWCAATWPAAQAATITANPAAIDEAADTDGLCSLREAVLSIDSQANRGGCLADVTQPWGTNDTINLPAGTYTLTVSGLDEGYTDTAPTDPNVVPTVTNTPDATIGDLDLTLSVKIVGAGRDATIIKWASQATVDRLFHVYAASGTVNVTLQGLTLADGVTVEQLIKSGPASTYGSAPTNYYLRRAGGALAVGAAAAVVLDDPNKTGSVNMNEGGRGGGKPAGSTDTGATYNVTLTDVKVDHNSAGGDGGGIYNSAPFAASGLIVSNNTALTNGGGIYNEGSGTISTATLMNNTAEGGGGFFATGSNTVSFVGVTISGNQAVGGGGISLRAGVSIHMVNSTLSGNIGTDVGGGLYSNGSALLNFVTIARNLAGADSATAGAGINTYPSQSSNLVIIKNVLIAQNKKGYVSGMTINDPALLPADCGYTGSSLNVVSQGHNLSSDDSCSMVLIDSGDLTQRDALLGDLADNGASVQTHALLAGSPAIGAGVADPNVLTDERGVTRDATPDIGAYELPAPTVATAADGGGGGGGCTLSRGASVFDPIWGALLAAAAGMLAWRHRRGVAPARE